MAEQEKNSPPVTEEELRDLPRWAIVAFAARCARRVQPLFEAGWPDAPEEHKDAVEWAIRVAEQRAAHPRTPSGAGLAGLAGAAAAAAAADLTDFAARAARDANTAVRDAFAAARLPNDDSQIPNATHAAVAAIAARAAARASAQDAAGPIRAAAEAVDASHAADTYDALRHDFELLRACAAKEGWTDETPVPAEFFGPLWPHGEPEGWPDSAIHCEEESAEDAAPETLRLSFLVNEYADEEAAAEAIANFCRALSRYHIALGGEGLTIDDWRIFVPEPEPEEVC